MAVLFAKRGAIVVLCDTNEIGNSQTIELISAINNERRFYSYTCDIGNRDEVDQLIKKIQAEVGDITILVNNGNVNYLFSNANLSDYFLAAVITTNSILDMSEEEFLQCLNANLFSAYWVG
jgi:NAD(P)-dependent dehydrogenase (short-subunit alcohol dehydrogenase family)